MLITVTFTAGACVPPVPVDVDAGAPAWVDDEELSSPPPELTATMIATTRTTAAAASSAARLRGLTAGQSRERRRADLAVRPPSTSTGCQPVATSCRGSSPRPAG